MSNLLQILSLGVLALVMHYRVLAQQLLAPAWPLAVKAPFLNTWPQAGSTSPPMNDQMPNFWNLSTTGWFCGILVDGVAYRLLGEAPPLSIDVSAQLSVGITPTQTVVQMQAGTVNVTMSFLSPITVRPPADRSLSPGSFANHIYSGYRLG